MITWLKMHNVFLWILSLFVASLLWLYVQVSLDPETVYPIDDIVPTFIGEDTLLTNRNIQVMSGKDITLSVKLRGRRADLAKCDNENVQVIVDLTEINKEGVSRLNYAVKLPLSGVTVESRSRPFIEITSDKIVPRVLDVKVQGTMEVLADYILDDVTVEPQQIRVTGPAAVVNAIDSLVVAPNKEGIDRSTTLTVPIQLLDAEGNQIVLDALTLDTREVSLVLTVSMTKVVPLNVDVMEGGGALSSYAKIELTPKTVRIKGDPAELEQIDRKSVV
jgi:YbbR domain-containing protein